ncbi:hypothetical protein T484DRAFT_1620856 [Baffinella frigidus]|nr:hypothetical protein T484DRAFT_1620856 [Cryptophyta sp. CCMP2293]
MAGSGCQPVGWVEHQTLTPTHHTVTCRVFVDLGSGSGRAVILAALLPAFSKYTLHPTPYTLHPTPYTLHPTPYTLHPTPYTLHLNPEPKP